MAITERYESTPPVRKHAGVSPKADGHASLGSLVSTASHDMSRLIRDEIELAKAEAKQDAKRGAAGGAMFGLAALCGLLCLLALLVAAALGIAALGITLGFSWLIVAGGFFVLAGITALAGRLLLKRLGASRGSVREAKQSVAMFKSLKTSSSR
jgi:hypothetical protein